MKNKKSKTKLKGGPTDIEFYVQISVIAILLLVIVFGLGRISSGSFNANVATGIGSVSASEIIPSGIPDAYGNELKISYDDISPTNPKLADSTINVLANIDLSEILEEDDLQRYINILYKMENGISCEYCCGARSVIFENGEPACGCAHSYAMRGLTKYLLKYHGEEFSDEQILQEVGKWKVLFFPDIHEGKAQILEANGIDSTNYINLASNKYRGIEQGQASGEMVGGC